MSLFLPSKAELDKQLAALFRQGKECVSALVREASVVHAIVGGEDVQEEKREDVLLGIVENRESVFEEGAIFVLNWSSPTTLQVLHLLPISSASQPTISISQRAAVAITPGETQATSASAAAARGTDGNSLGKPQVVEFVLGLSDERGKRVESLIVGEVGGEVEAFLGVLRRLREVRDAEKSIVRKSESHVWLGLYTRNQPLPNRIIQEPRTSSNTSTISFGSLAEITMASNGIASTSRQERLVKLREQYVRKAMRQRELEWTHAESIKIRLATFNVNDTIPPSSTSRDKSYFRRLVMGSSDDAQPADVLVFGFQELDLSAGALVFAPGKDVIREGEKQAETREAAWTRAILEGVKGAEYQKVASRQFVGVLSVVLVKKELAPFVGDVSTDALPIGLMMGVMGNKAGTGVRMRIHGSYFTFVNSHLAAHTDQLEKRILDYQEIYRRLKFPIDAYELSKSVQQYEVIRKDERHVGLGSGAAGIVFWTGDLNFRLDQTDEVCRGLIKDKEYGLLLKKDQLNIERALGRAFKNFEEASINFPPTFKFRKGVREYDEKRTPAWCDRILWSAPRSSDVRNTTYTSHPEIRLSDHEPVSANFDVSVSVIDSVRWHRVQAEVGREADKIENDATPNLEVSNRGIELGAVEYMRPTFRTIVLRNDRQVEAVFAFAPSEPGQDTLCKPWMHIHPSAGIVLPGEQVTVTVSIQVGADCAEGLNTGQEMLEDILILHVEDGKDSFISIEGTYEPSCFGTSIEVLTRLPHPIRLIPRQSFYEELSPPGNALSLPREIWRLVNDLMANGADLPGIFLERGDSRFVAAIRQCLDNGESFDTSISRINPLSTDDDESKTSIRASTAGPGAQRALSVAEALLRLFESLPEPCVPFGRDQDACAAVISKDEAFQILDILPNSSANLLIYISSFLRYHIEQIESPSRDLKHKLATTFAHTLLRPQPGVLKTADMQGRVAFFEFLLE